MSTFAMSPRDGLSVVIPVCQQVYPGTWAAPWRLSQKNDVYVYIFVYCMIICIYCSYIRYDIYCFMLL